MPRLRAAASLALGFLLMVGWAAAYARLDGLSPRLVWVAGPALGGFARYLSGDYAGAARAYREARRGDWAGDYGADRHGALALAAGDPALAERRARTTSALVPWALEPRVTLAELALDAGQLDEARDLLAGVLARRPDHELLETVPSAASPRRRLTDGLLAAGRWPEAVAHVRAYARYHPADAEYLAGVASRLRQAGRAEELAVVQALLAQAEREARAPRGATADQTDPEAGPLALAGEVLALAGLDTRLAQLEREVEVRLGSLRPAAREPGRLQAVIRRAFSRAALAVAARRVVAARLGEPEAQAAVGWLRSPLGRRATELEGTLSSEGRSRFVRGFPEVTPPPARLALARRLEAATGVAALNAEARTAVERGVAGAAAPLLLESRRPDEPGLDAWMERIESTAFEAVTGILFAYRELEDAALEEMVRFREGPAGRWTSEVQRDALLGAIRAGEARAAAATGRR